MRNKKREEKIQEAAEHYEQVDATNLAFDYGWDDCDIQQQCFKAGVEWADRHPREGLWDAEKVCKWISERIGIDQKIETNSDGEPLADSYIAYCIARQSAADTMIKDLRKAMEE